ncbi:hypothetical protein S83_042927, partial [Arachis hypogaea]
VEYYGSPVSLKSIAQISTPDASSLLVQPYDKSSLKGIEKAIVSSDVGMTPNNDGEVIRLTLPQLTSERRKSILCAIGIIGITEPHSFSSVTGIEAYPPLSADFSDFSITCGCPCFDSKALANDESPVKLESLFLLFSFQLEPIPATKTFLLQGEASPFRKNPLQARVTASQVS